MSLANGPRTILMYKGVDISSELAPMVISITYTDNLHGEADEIQVQVHDKDGRWKGSWKPEPGDIMDLTIIDAKGASLPCGEFEMDEPEANGSRSGDFMTIRGLAAPISKALRTENTFGYEYKTLKAIVGEVTGRSGLSLEGHIKDLFFERVTQRRERDLEFLTRLAEETGHYFTVKGKRAILTEFKTIDGLPPALTVFHGDRQLISYSLKAQTADTYSKAKVSYLDQNKKTPTNAEIEDSEIKTGDVLKVSGQRVESKAHADALANSKLHFKNRLAKTGTIDLVGTSSLVAGATVKMAGFGQYSDTYLVNSSSHNISRGGHTCSGELVDARAK